MNPFLFSIVLLACSEKEATPQNDSETDSFDTAEAEESVPPKEYIALSGSLLYEDGTPISQETVQVQTCSVHLCMNASISEDGSFLFSYLEPDTYLFRVIATVEGDYATPFDLITIEEDDVQIETPIQIPTQTVKTELTSGLFHADDGLIVDIDPNTFESYEFSGDEYFSSVSIPVDEFPFSLGTLRVQGELIRIWYLGDFHAQTSTPWPIMIEGLQELEGETLYFFNANLNDYEWTELGSATVDEDGFIQSPIGIQHLSMLVVLKI